MSYLRWVGGCLREIRKEFGLAVLLVLFETSFGLLATYMQKFIIDDVFVQGQVGELPRLLLFFGIFVGLNAVLGVCAPYVLVRSEYRMVEVLLVRMLKHFYRFPLAKVQHERSGLYVQNLTSDLHETGSAIGFMIPRWIQQLVQMIVLIVIIGIAGPWILVSMLAIGVLYAAAARYFGQRMKAANARVQQKRTDLMIHIEEGISSTREVIAFHRAEWEAKIYHALFREYYEAVMAEGRTTNSQVLLSAPLRYVVNLVVLAFGGYQLMNGQLSLGMFVVLLQFANQLMECFQGQFNFAMMFISKMAFIDRLQTFFGAEAMDEGTESLEGKVRSLRFEAVDFEYEANIPVLRNVSLTLPIGRKIAFVGTSGGGKSTIAQLLMRFYAPTGGAIVVNGVPLSELRMNDWMSRIHIVFQDPYLLADTIRRNVAFGKQATEEALENALRGAQIWDAIQRFPKGLEETIGERGIQLSGGQRQRVSLARAILGDPEILILDEATSSLDMETEREMQRALDEVRAGKTTIIIAHRLSTIQNADVIFVMHQGQIVEQGTHGELMRTGQVYPDLVRTQEEQRVRSDRQEIIA
ncbi:ABC transporter ATP-binding protein [Paenibacillus aurantiacus]|uniref:ABC transporter ATP-binding protein n=1 Tax=Paenibacillus aurantiacus TaxID=1936118 RepID=A0ABV5KM50_9BACL